MNLWKKKQEMSVSQVGGTETRHERILFLDAARGAMILLMVGYHLLFDLVYYCGVPSVLLFNPVLQLGQPVGAGVFILMSGASSRVSRSNAARGLKLSLAAAAVTASTWFFDHDAFVVFGILHFLALASLLYAAARPLLLKIPDRVQPFLYAGLWAASMWVLGLPASGGALLWLLGYPAAGFLSTDYFPLLPWIFVFLFGTWFGGLVFSHRLPARVYEWKPRRLAVVGRASFWIYLIHQPVIMGIVLLLQWLF